MVTGIELKSRSDKLSILSFLVKMHIEIYLSHLVQ